MPRSVNAALRSGSLAEMVRVTSLYRGSSMNCNGSLGGRERGRVWRKKRGGIDEALEVDSRGQMSSSGYMYITSNNTY